MFSFLFVQTSEVTVKLKLNSSNRNILSRFRFQRGWAAAAPSCTRSSTPCTAILSCTAWSSSCSAHHRCHPAPRGTHTRLILQCVPKLTKNPTLSQNTHNLAKPSPGARLAVTPCVMLRRSCKRRSASSLFFSPRCGVGRGGAIVRQRAAEARHTTWAIAHPAFLCFAWRRCVH